MKDPKPGDNWTFLTNHARVLLLVAQAPEIRVREMAELIGITERAIHNILRALEDSGYLTHRKVGRRNLYRVRDDLPMRHTLHEDIDVAVLFNLITIRGEVSPETQG
jgi:DNA-binding Lrp family transcriptional regulator